MKQFYITVTNHEGGFDMATEQVMPHKFRMYLDLDKDMCIGNECLIRAVGSYQLAQNFLFQMIREPEGRWDHLSWERK